MNDFLEFVNYREYTITACGTGFTVFYCGDEVYFESMDEAVGFIDSLFFESEGHYD